MTIRHPRRRRAALFAARVGTILSCLSFAICGWGLSTGGLQHAAAATDAGGLSLATPKSGTESGGQTLASGGSATDFTFNLPTGASCTGDSTNDGYRWQTFMVPSTVDPATLQFGSQGPVKNGTEFRKPFFTTAGDPVVNQVTADKVPPATTGQVSNIPTMDFSVYAPGDVPAGTYNIGVACTKGPASGTQLDRFWKAQLTVTTAAGDQPAGFTWTAQNTLSSTTTTTSTSSTSTSTSSTSTSSTTSTTSTSSTTDLPATASGSGTNGSGTALGSTETPTAGGPPTSGLVGNALPFTGSSTSALLVWAFLCLVFGRMAILLARSPEIVTGAP